MDWEGDFEEFEYKLDKLAPDEVDKKTEKDLKILKTIYGRGEALNNKVYALLEKAEVINLKYITKIMGFVRGNFIDNKKVLSICQNKFEHISETKFFDFLDTISGRDIVYFLCCLFATQYVCISVNLLERFFYHLGNMMIETQVVKEKFIIFVKDKLIIHTWDDFRCILFSFCRHGPISNAIMQIMLQHYDFDIKKSYITMNELFWDDESSVTFLGMFINFYEKSGFSYDENDITMYVLNF